MQRFVPGVVLFCLLMAGVAYSQNAQLGGIVTDPTGALLPGVTISVTNTETGVVTTTLTNESGAYTFPSLQPGSAYKASASLPGFQTMTVTDIALGPTSVRQNFQLQLSSAQTLVEVSADRLIELTTSTASVGDVLPQYRINNLPIVGNNVLSFLNTLPGLRVSTVGPQFNTIGGLGLSTINVTRDGLITNDTRFTAEGDLSIGTPLPNGGGIGAMSPVTINPDLVGEVRLVLSPVDAEFGRGNAQIQVQTRSGTNKYAGSVVWNAQNTALSANTWNNNRQRNASTGAWDPLKPDWRNVHEYTASLGGPVQIPGLYNGKNKTFFFALWDQNISFLRATINARVLTKEARQGIGRFWEGWVADSGDPINNPTSFQTAAAATNPSIASVDFAGNPLRPLFWPNGTPYTGRLVCFSVFGNVKADGSPFGAADCPSRTDSAGNPYTAVAMVPSGGVWDEKRPTGLNSAGYFAKILARMPEPNNFIDDTGDGLISGVHRYLLTRRMGEPVFYNETLVGNDPYSNRKQLTLKIDHNFTSSHRISGSWSHQLDDNVVLRGEWPDGLAGTSYRRPEVLTFNFTSTLRPTLLNEARFGLNLNKGGQVPPWLMSDDKTRTEAQKLLAEGGDRNGVKYPIIVRPATGCTIFPGETTLAFDNGLMGSRLNCGIIVPNQLSDPLYEWVDNVSWTHGKHAFKFGGDLRAPRTKGYSFQPYVDAPYGNLGGAVTQSPFVSDLLTPSLGSTSNIFRQDSRNLATNLAYLLTDSIGGLNTQYWIENQADKDKGIAGWQDVTTRTNRFRNTVSTDYAFFAKDDYKLTKDLTLNLGVRYEYYSPPYLRSGLTATFAGLGDGMFGASRGAGGQLFNSWLQPGNLFLTNYGNAATLTGATPLECKAGVQQSLLLPVSTCDPNTLSSIEFVGPGSSNSGKSILPRDRNNFGPAIGFAWQLPWFGKGRTTVRGGYSVQFSRINVLEQTLAGAPGNTLNQMAAFTDADIQQITAGPTGRAINFSDLSTLVPRKPSVAPGLPPPIYARNISTTAYDPHLATPYVQNLTLSVTRELGRNMILDVRYVGTLARKLTGSIDLNTSTVLYNPELFHALEVTRAGGNDPLFDQMFAGIRLSGVSATVPLVDGVTSRGSEQLRQSTVTRTNLANGNFVAVANSLISGNAATSLSIAAGGQGITGLTPAPAFAILHNGCDRLANGLTNLVTRCFPENYLTTNPQLNNANYIGNFGRSNYHALQVGYTLRPTSGFSVQATYSWAKTMQLTAPMSGYTDPLNRELDHVRGLDPAHNLRTNGTIELPIGPNKLLFGGASGWVARLIERWQTSFILNMSTGQPTGITGAGTMRYGNPRYVVASPLWKIPKGKVKWDGPGGNTGTFFGDKFVTVRDPQCTNPAVVDPTLAPAGVCTLNALAMKVLAGTPGSFLLPDGSTSVVNVLVNPMPGQIGTLGDRTLESWGQFSLDGNVQKTFRLTESKQLSLRVDATNILNHPQPTTPNFAVGNTAFGSIGLAPGAAPKGNPLFAGVTPAQRNFQAQVRLTF
jgi:hypothetical protein